MDRITKKQRSFNMSQVKSENTKPELFVFSILDKFDIKYEKHFQIYGKPDIAFPELKVAVFINGEFWHGRKFNTEKDSYQDFWIKKIKENMIRDKRNYKLLKNEDWVVIPIWDKDIKKHPKRELNKIMRAINHSLICKADLQV